MNYLSYLLRAHTEYNLHSPYIFQFYNEIINSKIDRHTVHPPLRHHEQVIYKIASTFRPHSIYLSNQIPKSRIEQILHHAIDHIQYTLSPTEARLVITTNYDPFITLHPEAIIILYNPHKQGSNLEAMTHSATINITIDLYHIAIGMYRKGLRQQYFILR